MPGRTFIGLDPRERNRAEFETAGLSDGPFLSLARVVIGIVAGLIVVGVGYDLHHPGGFLTDCQNGSPKCDVPPGSTVPMSVWLGLAVLVAAVIIAWPYLKYALKMALGGNSRRSRTLYFIAAGLVLAGAAAFALAFRGERQVLGFCGLICDYRVPVHPAARPFIVPVLVVGVLCAVALVVVGVRQRETAD
jgi:hypothetical protein